MRAMMEAMTSPTPRPSVREKTSAMRIQGDENRDENERYGEQWGTKYVIAPGLSWKEFRVSYVCTNQIVVFEYIYFAP
jgi:hypothetical protein